VNGKRAYDLARQGIDVDLKPREVEIYALELLEVLPENRARFRVECSKGTYVRALGRDMALKLGTRGYLQELRRTRCGIFSEGDAITLENLQNVVYDSGPEKVLLSVQACLRDIAVIAVTEADAAKLRQGQAVSPKGYEAFEGEAVALCNGVPAALIRIDARKIAPVRVFNL
jgi:tRNA pseudouridine55 synthase